MLGKLLKYDLKWVYKNVVVLYILAIVFLYYPELQKMLKVQCCFQ